MYYVLGMYLGLPRLMTTKVFATYNDAQSYADGCHHSFEAFVVRAV